MSIDRINLLPESRAQLFVRDYIVRIGVVFVVFITVLIGVAAVLRVPAYVFLTSRVNDLQKDLMTMKSDSSDNNEDFSIRLATLSANITRLSVVNPNPLASAIIRNILLVSHPGIAITGMNFTIAAVGKPSALIVSGTAATRAALRSYHSALQTTPTVRSAELPVSVYAKDTDIPFTITLTFAP